MKTAEDATKSEPRKFKKLRAGFGPAVLAASDAPRTILPHLYRAFSDRRPPRTGFGWACGARDHRSSGLRSEWLLDFWPQCDWGLSAGVRVDISGRSEGRPAPRDKESSDVAKAKPALAPRRRGSDEGTRADRVDPHACRLGTGRPLARAVLDAIVSRISKTTPANREPPVLPARPAAGLSG